MTQTIQTNGVAVPDQIEIERTFPVPPERVWTALTDPGELARWFGTAAEVDLRPGGALRFVFGTSWDVSGVIEVIEPPRRLVYAWEADADVASGPGTPPMTRVEFVLDPIPDGTRLRVVESGFGALPASIRRSSRDGRVTGWTREMDHLVAYVTGEGD
ncbi:MAG: SRPBCC domain-containing protein [Thermomicrobiales bacterium]